VTTVARATPQTGQRASLHARKFAKLGLVQPMDFVLHLPLRYEDRTRISAIADLRPGMWAQVEGEVSGGTVSTRPRRQLSATLTDASGTLGLRWLHFYPSQREQLSNSTRLRAWGEVRGGLFGVEMVHPRLTRADTPLAATLTPVYPTTDGLAQTVLQRTIAAALAQADLQESLPEAILTRYGLMPFEQAIRTLHAPPPDVAAHTLIEHSHPAWQRISGNTHE